MRRMRPSLCSTTVSWRCRSNATTTAPEPSGAGRDAVSQPRVVNRSAACWSCGSGGANPAASFPSSCVCACTVSRVAVHGS